MILNQGIDPSEVDLHIRDELAYASFYYHGVKFKTSYAVKVGKYWLSQLCDGDRYSSNPLCAVLDYVVNFEPTKKQRERIKKHRAAK